MVAPTSIDHTPEFYISAIKDISLSRYLCGCAVTLAIYDWLLLLGDESNTIWKSRWTIPKVLYYLIRGLTLPFMILGAYELSDLRPALSKSFCAAWPALVTLPMFITFACINWLFTLRLAALYRRNRILVWFLQITFFLTYVASLAMIIAAIFKYRETVDYFPIFKACGAQEASPVFPAMFYAPAAFEFFIFALTAYRAYQDASIFKYQLNGGKGSAPFLIVLYRDGLVCFLVMLGARSWNIWIYTTQPITQLNLGTNIMWAINTILSTRVYLNLVWLAHKPDLMDTPELGGTPGVEFATVTYGGGRRVVDRSGKVDGMWNRPYVPGKMGKTGVTTRVDITFDEQWTVPTRTSTRTTNSEVIGAERVDGEMEMVEPSQPDRRASSY